MITLKEIIETTAKKHCWNSIVVASDDLIVVSKPGCWPVNIRMKELENPPCTKEKIIHRIIDKLNQSGVTNFPKSKK